MKQHIAQHELAVLDKLGVAAFFLGEAVESFMGLPDLSIDGIRGAQAALGRAMELALAIDDWDLGKRDLVRQYIAAGGLNSIDQLLEQLGVEVQEERAEVGG